LGIFDPNELKIIEINGDTQKSYAVVLAKPSFSKKEIRNKITSYALFHAKAIEDGDIAASLEDVIKVYEDIVLGETTSLERQMIYSEMLSDLNFILYNPKGDDKKLTLGK